MEISPGVLDRKQNDSFIIIVIIVVIVFVIIISPKITLFKIPFKIEHKQHASGFLVL